MHLPTEKPKTLNVIMGVMGITDFLRSRLTTKPSPGVKKRKRAIKAATPAPKTIHEAAREIYARSLYHTIHNQFLRYHKEKAARHNNNVSTMPWLYETYANILPQIEGPDGVMRLNMPAIYNNVQLAGVPREFDPIELRRLSQAHLAEICIDQLKAVIANAPWAIVQRDAMGGINASTGQKRLIRIIEAVKARGTEDNNRASDIMALLERPNKNQQSYQNLIEMAITDLMEVGDACWKLNFDKKAYDENNRFRYDGKGKMGEVLPIKPIEIQPIDILQMTKGIDSTRQVRNIFYYPFSWVRGSWAQSPQILSCEEVVWFSEDLRNDRYYGKSPTEKIAERLDLDLLALLQEKNYWAAGEIAAGILHLHGFSEDERSIFRDVWNEEGKGHPENMVMANSMNPDASIQIHKLGQTYQEMQMSERQLWAAKIIAATYGLNLTVVGLSHEISTRATAQVEQLVVNDMALHPRLRKMEHYINTQLIWPYWGQDLCFVVQPVLNIEERNAISTMALSQYQGGLITLNEARTMMGMEPVKEGDDFKAAPAPIQFDRDGFGKPGDEGDKDEGEGAPEDMDEGDEAEAEPSDVEDDEKKKFYTNMKALGLEQFASKLYKLYSSTVADITRWMGGQTTSLIYNMGAATAAIHAIVDDGFRSQFIETVTLALGEEMGKQWSLLAKRYDKDDVIDIDGIQRFTQKRIPYLAEASDTLNDQVLNVLADAVKKNYDLNDTIKHLQTTIADWSASKAETVARTELIRAAHETTQIFGAKYGDEFEKKWIATKDHRTRAAHLAMDGTTLPMTETFAVPYGLQDDPPTSRTVAEMTPGDSIEGINCRCVMTLIARD